MKQGLDVYLHRVCAGRLTRDAFGTMAFTYEPAYVEQNLPTLSLSLPPRKAPYRGKVVNAFFFGALPGFLTMRRKLSRLIRRWLWNCVPDPHACNYKERYIGLPERERWAWLVEKGIEVGAISLHPVFATVPPTLDEEIEIVLDNATIAQVNKYPKSYASVDGRNCMIPARIDREGRVVLVRGQSPTLSTHFVKYMGKENRALNELFCMRLARSVGLVVPDVAIRDIDGYLCYLIKRYDRTQFSHETQSINMLHQESLCQALGVPVGVWIEHHGGPTVKQTLALLHEYSSEPERDKSEFLARLVFGYLAGCLDINGRNVSLLYRNGRPELAPAYDLSLSVPTAKMPMSIGGVCIPERVNIQHWYSAVVDRDRHALHQQLVRLSESCEGKASELVAEMKQEGFQSEIFNTVCTEITQRASRIKQQLCPFPH